MSTATCPNCGHSLTVRLLELDGPAPRPSLRFEAGPGALTCPNCGHSLTVRLLELDGPAPRPALRFEAGPGDLPIARPRPVSRGTGPDRLKAWGAVADTPVAPGDRLQIVAKSGKTWAGTVAECLGAAAGGGHLVTLAGAEWTPDPDVDADGRHPSDPAWLHDDDNPAPGAAPQAPGGAST